MRLIPPLGAIAAGAVLIAGCGSSKKSATTSAAPGASAPAQSTPATSPEGASRSAGTSVTVSTKPNKLGLVLAAGPKRLTVYLFEADTGPAPRCAGACAGVWPPVQAAGPIVASGGVSAGKLSRITRADGTKQLAYNGHPLYFYGRDGDKSDAYGQGLKSFGAGWYVLAPNGKKIDKS